MTTTTDVVVASNLQDARAVQAVEQHHAELAGRLARHVGELLASARRPDGAGFADARRAAARFCTDELVPHARAEEESLYPAAAGHAPLLVEGMLAEHKTIARLVGELASATEPVPAAAAGYALQVLFETHLAKENELLLPLVAADPAVSLADVLVGMHELLGPEERPAHSHASCSCHDSGSGVPQLDVRTVPHEIRHATVFGAFDAIPPGGSLLLIAPHDPLPLLRQLGERVGGRLEVSYLDRGPQAWLLRLTRG